METHPTTTDLQPAFCATCGARLSPGARFCHRCGSQVGAASAPNRSRDGSMASSLPWAVAALALIAVIGVLAGQYLGRRPAGAGAAAGQPPVVPAPDISQMSPEERASRLFDRVMRYIAAGQTDSANFFAPMAIGANDALTPRTSHVRYDRGLLALALGDRAGAAALADTILRENPKHLLGLILAARAADAAGDTAKRAGFDRRLLAAQASELARGLPEYEDHRPDITSAIADAKKSTAK